jgi:WhiB family transcriptional regulator, redox-sensing transcriptional regulator
VPVTTAAEKWRDSAACLEAPLELFYIPDGIRGHAKEKLERQGLKLCAGCPVAAECLAYAMDASNGYTSPEKYGTWGGLTEEQRHYELRRKRRHKGYLTRSQQAC